MSCLKIINVTQFFKSLFCYTTDCESCDYWGEKKNISLKKSFYEEKSTDDVCRIRYMRSGHIKCWTFVIFLKFTVRWGAPFVGAQIKLHLHMP